jgi:hypothetical protein
MDVVRSHIPEKRVREEVQDFKLIMRMLIMDFEGNALAYLILSLTPHPASSRTRRP